MSLIISKGITLRKTWQPMDSDAAAYIAAVEAADGQSLEEPVKIAIDNFVLGCKADGIWNAIKASCILAGARTLAGALVPMVGPAPTNVGFVAGDYDRETGLVGDGSTKYLDSNRAGNADPQNNAHFSIRVTTAGTATTGRAYMGHVGVATGSSSIGVVSTNGALFISIRAGNETGAPFALINGQQNATGFIGASRSNSTQFSYRLNGATNTFNAASTVPAAENWWIYRRATISGLISNPRLAFYSIGESLDLALLDARVTDLMNAFAAAIP